MTRAIGLAKIGNFTSNPKIFKFGGILEFRFDTAIDFAYCKGRVNCFHLRRLESSFPKNFPKVPEDDDKR